MRGNETEGVAAVARLLASVAGTPGRTVAALAGELGVRRSTAFAVVALLDASGLLERDAGGRLHPGPAAARLGLSLYGFGAMAWEAEALLPVLRDDTDASVSLVIGGKERALTAFRRRASWEGGIGAGTRAIEETVGRSAPGFVARLRLALRPNAGEAEARSASACASLVAARLSKALEGSGPPPGFPAGKTKRNRRPTRFR